MISQGNLYLCLKEDDLWSLSLSLTLLVDFSKCSSFKELIQYSEMRLAQVLHYSMSSGCLS